MLHSEWYQVCNWLFYYHHMSKYGHINSDLLKVEGLEITTFAPGKLLTNPKGSCDIFPLNWDQFIQVFYSPCWKRKSIIFYSLPLNLFTSITNKNRDFNTQSSNVPEIIEKEVWEVGRGICIWSKEYKLTQIYSRKILCIILQLIISLQSR